MWAELGVFLHAFLKLFVIDLNRFKLGKIIQIDDFVVFPRTAQGWHTIHAVVHFQVIFDLWPQRELHAPVNLPLLLKTPSQYSSPVLMHQILGNIISTTPPVAEYTSSWLHLLPAIFKQISHFVPRFVLQAGMSGLFITLDSVEMI